MHLVNKKILDNINTKKMDDFVDNVHASIIKDIDKYSKLIKNQDYNIVVINYNYNRTNIVGNIDDIDYNKLCYIKLHQYTPIYWQTYDIYVDKELQLFKINKEKSIFNDDTDDYDILVITLI